MENKNQVAGNEVKNDEGGHEIKEEHRIMQQAKRRENEIHSKRKTQESNTQGRENMRQRGEIKEDI